MIPGSLAITDELTNIHLSALLEFFKSTFKSFVKFFVSDIFPYPAHLKQREPFAAPGDIQECNYEHYKLFYIVGLAF